jgi:alanine racemase
MRLARATIDLDAISSNLNRLRAQAARAKILAVVKADGYGHGLERVAQCLLAADGFGVASLEDAERLRAFERERALSPRKIVLLSGFFSAAELKRVQELKLTSVLHEPSQLAIIRSANLRTSISAWIKLDTGMHRLGFDWRQSSALRAELSSLPIKQEQLVWMSHFASADLDSPLNATQLTRFKQATAGFEGARSCANSAALLRFPESHLDWVRPGGLLYGLSTQAGQSGSELGFLPAMRLSTRVIAIKTVARGETIGYGEHFRAERDMRIGILSFGYGDGYPRHASAKAKVWVAGHLVALAGRVSMDLMCVDLSDHPSIELGAEAVLWGPELAVEQVAEWADSISYELTCGITRRVRFVESMATPLREVSGL